MKKRDGFYFTFSIVLLHEISIYPLTVLLTGGAGFIGSHVAEKLLMRGDKVVIVDDVNNYYDVQLKYQNLAVVKARFPNVEFYQGDICDKDFMTKVMENAHPDAICHLAARAGVRASIEQPELYCKTNIIGTVNLLELAKTFGVKNFVMASSSSVYGQSSTPPFSEVERADNPVSPYAATKRACELLGYTYHVLYKIPCSCLRFFTVYGPRGRPDMAPFKFLDAIYHERPILQYGDGSAIRDFTYVDDIVDGVIAAIDNPQPFEIYNLGRGQPVVLKDFIKVIEDVTQKKAIIHQVGQVEGDVDQTHADISRARDKLGYSPKVSIKEGMERFFAWYKKEYLPSMNES